MEADQRIAKEGALFATSGIEFGHPGKNEKRLGGAQRLALAVIVGEHERFPRYEQKELASFGSERRIVSSCARAREHCQNAPQN